MVLKPLFLCSTVLLHCREEGAEGELPGPAVSRTHSGLLGGLSFPVLLRPLSILNKRNIDK